MTVSDIINAHRTEQIRRQDVINEFRYRQVLALTMFELRCRHASPQERQFLVSNFESNADEMSHHGYYNHYHDRLLYTLTHREDSISGLTRHIALKPTEAEAVMMSYHLSTPADREKFKRHIIAGVVETRPEIQTLKPDFCPLAKETTQVLGSTIISHYQPLLHQNSDFNVFAHLSRQSVPDRKVIHSLIMNAVEQAQNQGITEATKQLTDDLLPYYFREAKPYIASSQQAHSAVANYAAFYARPQKFFRMRNFIASFAWVFLTEHPWNQNLAMDHLNPERQRQIRKRIQKMYSDPCLCHD